MNVWSYCSIPANDSTLYASKLELFEQVHFEQRLEHWRNPDPKSDCSTQKLKQSL